MTTVSSDADNDFPARIKQVSELEKQLKSQIKEKRAFHVDIRNLRLKLREKYSEIILTEPELSEKYDTATSLWHFVFYVMIDEFRNRIRFAGQVSGGKPAPDRQRVQRLLTEFRSFIADTTKFYSGLILKLKEKYGLPAEDGSEFGSEVTEFKRTCHRFYIHLGDLARYKEVHCDAEGHSPDWSTPAGYYFKAVSLWPAAGHPHNQLAVLATYMHNDFLAVYHYSRSLGVEDSFITARGNLILLFDRNRQQYSEITDQKRPQKKGKESPKPESEQDTKQNFLTRFVRLNGILFSKTSLETFSDVYLETTRDLEKLLSAGSLESVFTSELRKAEDSAKGLALGLLQLMTILISSVPTGGSRNSYADALQHKTISKYALTAAYRIAGCFMSSCGKSSDVAESAFLPASLVFMEWLASRQDLAAGASGDDDKHSSARAGFWKDCLTLLNKICDEEDEEISSKEAAAAALWEDHELAGFTPLSPAHLGLTFNSRSSNEALARTSRFVAAGKALAKILEGSTAGLSFDEDMGRFFLAGEHREKRPKEKVVLSKTPVTDVPSKSLEPALKPAAAAPPVEEDDEEVIVFQPAVKLPDPKPLGDTVKEATYAPSAVKPGTPVQNPATAELVDPFTGLNVYDPLRASPGNIYRGMQNDGVPYGLPTETEFNKCFGLPPAAEPAPSYLEPAPVYLEPHRGTFGIPVVDPFYVPSSVSQMIGNGGGPEFSSLLHKLRAIKDQQNAAPPEHLVDVMRERAKVSSVRPPPGFGPIPQRAVLNQKLQAAAPPRPLVEKEVPGNNLNNNWMDSFSSGRAAGQPLYGPNWIWSNNNGGNGAAASRSSAYPFPGMGVHTVQQIEQQLPPAVWKGDPPSAGLSFEQPQQVQQQQQQAQQPPFRQYRPQDPFVS